jgi:hypothetical protein
MNLIMLDILLNLSNMKILVYIKCLLNKVSIHSLIMLKNKHLINHFSSNNMGLIHRLYFKKYRNLNKKI